MTLAPSSTSDIPDEELAAIETAAVEIAIAAGEIAARAFVSGGTLEFKGPRQDDPVTATDREIETFLRRELRARFPEHGLLGEEHADDIAQDAAYVWVLDPLDGTANFASGLPLWGVSMGLLHHGVPVVGCIWMPSSPWLTPGVFHARHGGGAWFGDHSLRVAEGEDVRGRLIALPGRYWRIFGFLRPPAGTPRAQRGIADPRALGSIAAELCLVAAGTLRLATFVQPKIWDVAAGVLLVSEAGGNVHTWQDRAWRPFAQFRPARPPRKRGQPDQDGPLALRHWSQPLVAGTPSTAVQVTEQLVWRPRLPRALQQALGLLSRDL